MMRLWRLYDPFVRARRIAKAGDMTMASKQQRPDLFTRLGFEIMRAVGLFAVLILLHGICSNQGLAFADLWMRHFFFSA
jgi:hypothetical protein